MDMEAISSFLNKAGFQIFISLNVNHPQIALQRGANFLEVWVKLKKRPLESKET